LGCGDKKDVTTRQSNVPNANLVKKDSVTGKDKIQLKYVVNKGDKFRFKVSMSSSSSDKNTLGDNKEITQSEEQNYFYSKEVTEIDNNGIITFKVTCDSITIDGKYDTITVKYSSNLYDSVRSQPNFFHYNSMAGESFFMRVSSIGEVTEVYGMEKIYDNLFKAFGDTLTEDEKAYIKQTQGLESIKDVLQQEYQVFPKNEVFVDSSWTRQYNAQLFVFGTLNTNKYILKNLEEKNEHMYVIVDATQVVEFQNKEAKDKGITYKLTNSETSGTGRIQVNLSRGCVVTKETSQTLKLEVSASAQGQSAKMMQTVVTHTKVTLLNP
jgi:hypothetical protein